MTYQTKRYATPTPRLITAASVQQLVIPCDVYNELSVTLVVAAAALTNFTIAARSNANVTQLMTLYSVAGDFTSPQGLLIGCSGDLTTQAIGTGWFIMDIRALYSVELYATSGGTATLYLEAGLS